MEQLTDTELFTDLASRNLDRNTRTASHVLCFSCSSMAVNLRRTMPTIRSISFGATGRVLLCSRSRFTTCVVNSLQACKRQKSRCHHIQWQKEHCSWMAWKATESKCTSTQCTLLSCTTTKMFTAIRAQHTVIPSDIPPDSCSSPRPTFNASFHSTYVQHAIWSVCAFCHRTRPEENNSRFFGTMCQHLADTLSWCRCIQDCSIRILYRKAPVCNTLSCHALPILLYIVLKNIQQNIHWSESKDVESISTFPPFCNSKKCAMNGKPQDGVVLPKCEART